MLAREVLYNLSHSTSTKAYIKTSETEQKTPK
jgi:hypothetical protein